MKSMFSMGFFSNDVFHAEQPYLGQISFDPGPYLASLNAAFAQYNQVNSWINAHPNYGLLLGGQSDNFQNLLNFARSDAAVAQDVQATLLNSGASASVTPSDKTSTDAFISEANSLLEIVNSAPTGPGAVPAPASSSSGGLPGLFNSIFGPSTPPKPTVPGAAVPVPPPSSVSPAIVVGGVVVGVGLLALLLKA